MRGNGADMPDPLPGLLLLQKHFKASVKFCMKPDLLSGNGLILCFSGSDRKGIVEKPLFDLGLRLIDALSRNIDSIDDRIWEKGGLILSRFRKVIPCSPCCP